jgi:ribonuclease G
MAKEICISSTPHETRLAILEDDQLAEIYYERENEYTLAGSIYNGRVTRVLPGMQSAFVDVGLERDAFLYVTDFMELEDPEETDEIEKAAATGGNTPPREVRHAAPKEPAQERPAARPAPPQEPRPERPNRDRRPPAEVAPPAAQVVEAVPESVSFAEQSDAGDDDSGAPGAKRWRGRRRRRGGRGQAGSPEGQQEAGDTSGPYVEEIVESEPEIAPQIQAAAGFHPEAQRTAAPAQAWSAPQPAPRFDAAPVPFVLPGESLRKYGGAPADDATEESPAPAPPRPASTFKPPTLIDSPIQWDGSGLLPGETLSRHRGREPEPAEEVKEEPRAAITEAPEPGNVAPDAIEEQDFFAETKAAEPAELAREAEQNRIFEVELLEDEFVEEELTEETVEAPQPNDSVFASETLESTTPEPVPATTDKEDYTVETVIEQPSADEAVADSVVRQDETIAESAHDEPAIQEAPEEPATTTGAPGLASETGGSAKLDPEPTESDPNADASHHVDPQPPTSFRLFGFGSKKKDEEEPAKPEAKPTSVASVSAYAPGVGVIEEELIEEEEFDAPRHKHRGKAQPHDNDDFEEETLPPQMRTGDLGEMLQEAHLDHRIQLNFDGKSGEEEDGFDEDEDEDEPGAEGQPAAATSGQKNRDRNARGRRGRGGPSAPGGPAQNRGRGPSRRSMQTSDLPIISDLLKPGQEILVQIAKEPIAKKGARITSHIALPGRFLVFMPTVSHIGVSRKIASEEERQRLKRILVHERGEAQGGFIVRTAAEGASEEDLRADLRFLIHLWNEIKTRSDSSKSPALIYHDLSLIERILRDQVSSNFSNIWVDTEENYERIVRFLNRFSPTLVRRVKLYTKETPLFEHFGIQDEISKALRSKVWLKSGGSIVINQTEALVAIDINTGKYVGKSARLEDTILKTNLDAVPEIVRQIRLRDLGGIIVIDFIDMDERKNRFRVMAALEEALKSDRAPTKVLQFNDFGLVAITRKRVKQSLERTLSVPCPTCQATGMVKSPTTVCNEIYTELRKMRKHFEGADVLLRVNPETVKVLKQNNASWLTEFEELVGKNILVKSDPTLHPEQFDIQG